MNSGDRVVCIKADSGRLLKKNNVYTIFRVVQCIKCRKRYFELYEVPPGTMGKDKSICPVCESLVSIGILVFADFLFVPLQENHSKDIVSEHKEVEEKLEIVEPVTVETV